MNDKLNTPGDGGMELRLWDYIDGLSGASERAVIEKLIAENREWQDKYKELLEIHQLINSAELEQPSLRFTKNVMEEIAKHHIAPATKEYIDKKVIWGIAAFFITVIVGFLGYAIAQIDWSAGSNSIRFIGVDFSQVDYSRMFNNTYMNVFMMLNIVLGLLLLDRYLANKKRKLIEEA
ncbi:MAG: hypothetical protein M3342_08535 [Bacteroidota bacterium]|nr:hypothetical protein [Bacteroidota bacterium]